MSNENYNRAFISYIDEKGEVREGYFNDVVLTESYVSFDTEKNRLALPWDRIKKVKGPKGGG